MDTASTVGGNLRFSVNRLAIASLVGLSVLSVSAGATQFWLSGEDPVVQLQKHKDNPADYMQLFDAESPWRSSASGLQVFKISMQMAIRGTDEQLRAVIGGLAKRRIKLAVEMAVVGGSDKCGGGVEGYSSPAGPEAAARRIKKLGGRIDYIAMDEPVWFGHLFVRRGADRVGCRYGLAELADRVASKVSALRTIFPEVLVGDIEPINAVAGGSRSIDDIMEFESLLHDRTMVAPAFVHADVSWSVPEWTPLLEEFARRAKAKGYRFGIICNGDDSAYGDEAWVRQALDRCRTATASPQIRPDDVIIQSWNRLPTNMLPDSASGTLTYALRQAEILFH